MIRTRYLFMGLFLGLSLLVLVPLLYFTSGEELEEVADSSIEQALTGDQETVDGDKPECSGDHEGTDCCALLYPAGLVQGFDPVERDDPGPFPLTAQKKSTQVFAAPSAPLSTAGKEQQMVGLINQARSNAGLPPLTVSGQLTAAARAKSADMAVNNYFSHNSPTYGSFTALLSRYGIRYRAAAENIAWNSNGSASAAHHGLMGSSGHRNNILGRNFQYVGVGIHTRSDGRHYYTQLFIGY